MSFENTIIWLKNEASTHQVDFFQEEIINSLIFSTMCKYYHVHFQQTSKLEVTHYTSLWLHIH